MEYTPAQRALQDRFDSRRIPVPDWKRAEWARDALPAGDPAAAG